jgi:hypothetical protein
MKDVHFGCIFHQPDRHLVHPSRNASLCRNAPRARGASARHNGIRQVMRVVCNPIPLIDFDYPPIGSVKAFFYYSAN